LLERKEGRLFKDLLQTLEFYAHFEINDHTGLPLTRFEMEQKVPAATPFHYLVDDNSPSDANMTACFIAAKSSEIGVSAPPAGASSVFSQSHCRHRVQGGSRSGVFTAPGGETVKDLLLAFRQRYWG